MKLISISLKTNEAKFMVRGRPGNNEIPPIYGMLTFARILNEIWKDSLIDNPYSDYYLLQVEESFLKCESYFNNLENKLFFLLKPVISILKDNQNTCNDLIELNFSNPYSYIGANLLKKYDTIIQLINNCLTLRLISRRQKERYIRQSTRFLRGVYHSISSYKSIKINRENIKRLDELAKLAEIEMGKIDVDILIGKRLPKYMLRETLKSPYQMVDLVI